ncbi:MAG: glycosyl transferase family 1 [Isosphaeraceae bacterium]|jgi:glycosyltransferase involved in cell wall biosynthesis|nr:MAG: glycosyl transferase family 1 [Isosphaeraceae bacterium]
MHIGIDGACLANRRGFGRFTRELLAALSRIRSRHRFTILVDSHALASGQAAVPDGFDPLVVPVRQAPTQAASAEGRRSLADLFAFSRAAAAARLDCLYLPSTYTAFPVWNVRHLVVTVHDTMPLSHPELIFRHGRGRLAWRIKEAYAVHRARRVVTLSHASRRDIIKYYHIRNERLRVIPEAASPVFRPLDPADHAQAPAVLSRYGIPADGPFLLYVGGFSPHKNLLRLIDAFAQLDDPTAPLVLVGDLHDVFNTHVPELRARVERWNLGPRVIWTGYVADDDLRILYARACALVLPSLIEGFGLPAIEAMACGTPVAYADTASLPEVVGEAGLGFDPASVSQIAAALNRLLTDRPLRAELAGRALARAQRFTWSAAAQALLTVFDELEDQTRGPASRIVASTDPNRSKFSRNRRANSRTLAS